MSNPISPHQPLPAARRAGNQVSNSPPFEWLARAGFIARGAVYLIIGVLAAKLALRAGGKGEKNAMRPRSAESNMDALIPPTPL